MNGMIHGIHVNAYKYYSYFIIGSSVVFVVSLLKTKQDVNDFGNETTVYIIKLYVMLIDKYLVYYSNIIIFVVTFDF